MANHSITTQKCYPHCFYETYPTLGVKLGVRSYRKDLGILNVTCALAFTGRDAGKTTQFNGSFHNNDDLKANPVSFVGWCVTFLTFSSANDVLLNYRDVSAEDRTETAAGWASCSGVRTNPRYDSCHFWTHSRRCFVCF